MTYIGTSGYSYEHWTTGATSDVLNFYPSAVKTSERLQYYATQFNFVEINSTFYQLPSKATVKKWYDSTPADFRFTVKFSRYGTHSKKLVDFDKTFDDFWVNRLDALKEKCIGILIQLPPGYTFSEKASPKDQMTPLQRLRKAGEHTSQYAVPMYVEFRDTSWFNQEVYNVLAEIGWSLVCVHVNNDSGYFGAMNSGFSPSLEELSVSGRYFRCHGTKDSYKGDYDGNILLDMWLASQLQLQSTVISPPVIFAFDNTDSYHGSVEMGGQIWCRGDALTPSAVYDARILVQLTSEDHKLSTQ